MKRTKKTWIVLLLVTLMTVPMLLSGCGKSKTIVVGSKDFSENIVLGEIFSQLVEAKTDIKVSRKLNMGGTFVNFEAIKNGQIDIYAEYTGTGLTAQLEMDVVTDPDEAYRIVSEEFKKQFGIRWMQPLGLNNTYAIAVTNDVYQTYGVETVSDLVAAASNLVFGAEHEFFDRQDGFDGLVKTYGLSFKGSPQKMNVSLKYQAMGKGDIDVTDAFSTDGQILQYNLKILEDDKNFFPPYYAAPIVREKTLEKYPELEGVLNLLAGQIDDAAMTELNYKIDVENKAVETVAKEFLQAKGLI